MGEIAGISPEELDALFELGAQRLDTERNHEAVEVFAGLVALYPYASKHWRAYGIALHRVMRLPAALAAYEASLLIEPEHLDTLCYQGEVLLYLNRLDEAETVLIPISQCPRQELKVRAEMLLQFLQQARKSNEPISLPVPTRKPKASSSSSVLESSPSEKSDTPLVVSEDVPLQTEIDELETPIPASANECYFELDDGRALPLEPSTFQDIDSPPATETDFDNLEPTVTSLKYRPIIEGAPRETTQTAIIVRPQLRLNEEGREEGTAIIPGRPAHRAQEEEISANAEPSEEVTKTAIVRRRSHLPLADEHTQIMPGRFFEDDNLEEN